MRNVFFWELENSKVWYEKALRVLTFLPNAACCWNDTGGILFIRDFNFSVSLMAQRAVVSGNYLLNKKLSGLNQHLTSTKD